MRQTGRGQGIQVLNARGITTVGNLGSASDFTDIDNNWNNVNTNLDQFATDAYWGQEKTYDYYRNRFNRNSINNQGYLLRGYVHANLVSMYGIPNNVNAFWDTDKMLYGDGGTQNNVQVRPLTAVDIVGHEITHGLTQFTAALGNSGEAGVLNESFSDIFGTAIENYAKGYNFNWTVGENTGLIFRSLSNPNAYSHPDTYGGTF
ncbi:Thermolysin [Adhaeribacter pallidiroseus]|uniref:Neutral metalloproteinase n=1 Tax=Adhaeribacter pallidiroseus TaxID=2072847 RepID=A0A369QHM6_9BACT|nr:Thermolysin [Adhaeribacter pallidiroseus]